MVRRAFSSFAIALGIWAALAAAPQTPASARLTPALRTQLQDARLEAVTAIRGLPLGVRDGLSSLFGGSLDIANPGAPFQSTAVAQSGVPLRRLAVAGCAIDLCVVYYERGGGNHSWHVAVFHWMPAETRFEWGGTAPAGLATVDAVRGAVLSGAVKGPSKIW